MKSMDKFAKLLKGKKGELDETGKEAHRAALGGIKKEANDFLTGKLRGLKKVTVAGDSDEAVETGLEKAKEMLSGEEPAEMGDVHPGLLGDDEATPSVEELDAKIQHLMKMRDMLKHQQ